MGERETGRTVETEKRWRCAPGVLGGKATSLALLWGCGRSAEAAAAGAGVRRLAICSLVRVHLFKLLSSLSFSEASEGEAEHEEKTEIK